MTDIEATTRYIKAFGNMLPDFSTDYYERLHTGTEWMRSKFPQSPYTELIEEYQKAILMIVSIEHEILVKGGKDFEQCTKV